MNTGRPTIVMQENTEQGRVMGMIYYTLRGIMVTIGITPPPPGKERWVAVVFFGSCALLAISALLFGALLLRNLVAGR